MSKLIFVLVLLVPVTHAAPKTWWGRFCEKYLVADDPYQFEPRMAYLRNQSATQEEFITKLIGEYRQVGASLSWRQKRDDNEVMRIYLRTIGRELRRSQVDTPRADVEDILDLYSKFERESP